METITATRFVASESAEPPAGLVSLRHPLIISANAHTNNVASRLGWLPGLIDNVSIKSCWG
ncbi:hypothetical protein RBSWK_00553 [Rhodopirellula baltica SWK14]|uniref:Uncharacterized protein n=1 Tax=Rhodopirellula baltica SWK14 TaxID=993516 RepID=L7CNX5_RHOBT|nr:hypothetical protein RBSWK_00553 [Rhodopirellula baltica SWK14]